MDPDLSAELTSRMPILPHEIGGVECCGCIIAAVDGTNVELRCNECGAVVGVVHLDILKGLLGLECATATCPHCGRVNTFPCGGRALYHIPTLQPEPRPTLSPAVRSSTYARFN